MKLIRRPVPKDASLPGIDPILTRIYAGRDVTSPEAIDYRARYLAAPHLLLGIEAAAEVLCEAVEADARIVLVGDFDADGATSCAAGVLGLRRLGATDVHYLVPNRFDYGYGLTPEIVGVAAALGPDVLITVDNGISSHQGVAVAKELGITVIITDHHLPGESLPPADAIVNPNVPGDGFPSKNLAGVGVAFYLLLAVRAGLRARGWFRATQRSEPNLAELLDLVALGTVADVVSLDRNNRILVAQGLARINAGRCRPGIQALLELSSRGGPVGTRDLAFGVAPRLNAAGRLEDMSTGIECLLADDQTRAQALASKLDELNRQRRDVQRQMQHQADEFIKELDIEGAMPHGVTLYDDRWHEGIVGLIASRVKERLHRPVVAFARSEKNGELKGSARSIPTLHIRDLLEALATREPDLLSKFGGHAMAAGLSLKPDHLERFRKQFASAVGKHFAGVQPMQTVETDGPLEDRQISLELAEALAAAGPWGQSFPEPLFDDTFEVLAQRVVGECHLKLRLRRAGGERVFDAIAFGVLENAAEAEPLQWINAAYRLETNDYGGTRTPQLNIEWFEPLPGDS